MLSKYYFFAHHIVPHALFKNKQLIENDHLSNANEFMQKYITLWYNMHLYQQKAIEVLNPTVEKIIVEDTSMLFFSLPHRQNVAEGQWGILIQDEKSIRYFIYEKGIRGAYYLNEWSKDNKCTSLTHSYEKKNLSQIKRFVYQYLYSKKQNKKFLKAV